MKRDYLWLGEQRMLPGVGAPKPGEIISMDEALGRSYKDQGLCEEAPVVDEPAAAAAEEE